MTDWNQRFSETNKDENYWKAKHEQTLRDNVRIQPGLRMFETIQANLQSINAFRLQRLELTVFAEDNSDFARLEARLLNSSYTRQCQIYWNPRDGLHWCRSTGRSSHVNVPLESIDAATEFAIEHLQVMLSRC
jgi:hypothetical protein